MQASVPELAAARLSVQQVDIGQLNAGPISVGRLVLDDMRVDVSTGTAAFVGLQVTVDLDMSLEWAVRVKVPVVGGWTCDGTIELGGHSCSVTLGDVTLPGLQAFTLDLAGLSVDGISATVAPLHALRLGPLVADGLAVSDVLAPVAGFTLSGMGLGRLAVDGAGVPAVSASAATLTRLSGQGLPARRRDRPVSRCRRRRRPTSPAWAWTRPGCPTRSCSPATWVSWTSRCG